MLFSCFDSFVVKLDFNYQLYSIFVVIQVHVQWIYGPQKSPVIQIFFGKNEYFGANFSGISKEGSITNFCHKGRSWWNNWSHKFVIDILEKLAQ